MNEMDKVAKRIKDRRIELGISQDALAKALGYTSRSSITKIEKNAQLLPQKKVMQIAKALRVSPGYLMGWDDEETQSSIKMPVLGDVAAKEIFSNNLNYYMKKHKYSQKQLAEMLGVTPQALSKWCVGLSLPRMGKVQMLADIFGIEKSDLIDEPNINKACGEYIKIPVLGDVAAGVPMDAIENIIDYEEIPERYGRIGEFFALRIHGDSMEPRICEGDIVIVRQQPDAESGDLCIVRVSRDTATCKILRKYADGAVELVSINPSYEPMFYSREQVESEPVEVVGVVIENRQKYKQI